MVQACSGRKGSDMGRNLKMEFVSELRRQKDYISGQELCSRFQISRTMVWKIMNQLKEEGYQIEAVTNRGYRLLQSPDVVTMEEITSMLRTKWLGKKVLYYDTTDSTNLRAKEAAEAADSHGLLVIADSQEAGRGRRGRNWTCEKGEALAMSFVLKPKLACDKLSMITLLAAVAVSRAIERVSGLANAIKWPNDIVIHGRKVCGILTEMSTQEDYVNHVVVGIGVNVNTAHFPEEIKDMAGSLFTESGKRVKRAELAAAILEEFETIYEQFEQTENLSFLQEEYNHKLVNIGKDIKVVSHDGERKGSSGGINETGELYVTFEDGTRELVYSGEVSVRGLYGYI